MSWTHAANAIIADIAANPPEPTEPEEYHVPVAALTGML